MANVDANQPVISNSRRRSQKIELVVYCSVVAKMLPLRFPNSGVEGRGAEEEFFKQCERQLDDDWIVIYEVRFHGQRKLTGNVPTLGDIDFFLLHPKRGIFVVDVKGGEKISMEDGFWCTTPHRSLDKKLIKDPFIQILILLSFGEFTIRHRFCAHQHAGLCVWE